MVTECEYRQYVHPDDAECTGPIEIHDCRYERELADEGEAVKKCHCCKSCGWECYCNV